jgi:hypothetical protein
VLSTDALTLALSPQEDVLPTDALTLALSPQEDLLSTDALTLALSAAQSDTKRLCDVTRHIRASRAAFDNKHALLPYTAFSMCVQAVCHSGYVKSSL